MAYNYDDQIPVWQNEGTEPTDSVKTEGFKAGYKPPATYFNWFWSHTLKWFSDIRTKLSSLHTQVTNVESKIKTLENADHSVAADDILTKLKTVDGAESGLDADTVDGKHASDFADVNHTHTQYATASHNHAVATETSNGFMSAEMYSKLKSIDSDNLSTYTHPATHPASMITGLATVATSGNYADLVNKPILSGVATSGSYNDLKDTPTAYTHPATHPASMIEETENIKMMTAEERAKLAGIEAQANKYVHPSTHPASMISGLEDFINSLGYSKVASGSYVGAGTSEANSASTIRSTARQITLPFTPNAIMIVCANTNGNVVSIAQGKTYCPKKSDSVNKIAVGNLSGNVLKVCYFNDLAAGGESLDSAGYTYHWVAI